MRVGVFICHCGTNIASTVDVKKVAEKALGFPHVVYATDVLYACSEPGQGKIEKIIRENRLSRLVIAACSPKVHELTFQRAVERGGLNPYLIEIANIREQCSWIHEDKNLATEKAIDLVEMALARVIKQESLFPLEIDIHRKALVIGGGIAGIQASLDIAEIGLETVIAEREPTIGGTMAKLDKTFPTIDCSACILTPKMVEVDQNENIKLQVYSEIEDISGYVGNFKAKIRRKASFVDYEKCIGCGLCEQKCPAKAPNRFNLEMGEGKAIYIPFPQAVPKVATIAAPYCLYLKEGRCRVCEKICPTDAINFEMEDEIITEEFGAIVVATGFDLFDYSCYGEYGGGRYEDVISGLQYERLLSSSGPTSGRIERPSDQKEPKRVVFVSCVGSRDDSVGRPYCSGICCMYLAKQAMLTKERLPDSEVYVFYIDIRATGKAYEEFVRRAQEEYGVQYVRGRVAKIYPAGSPSGNGQLMIRSVDTLLGERLELPVDLVVLATGINPASKAGELAQKLRINHDQYGFFSESHPKLRPVETTTSGIFLAGVCQAPKDIPQTIAQASSAASKVQGLLTKDKLETSPVIAFVTEQRCVGCFQCLKVCPYNAIERKVLRDGRTIVEVIPTLCEGCGLCTATCPPAAIMLKGFTDDQLINEVEMIVQRG